MDPIRTRSAGGIVLGEGGVIAMVRTHDADAWLFPKGHVEPTDKNDEEAARREILEETGLAELEYLDDLGSYARPRITKDGGNDPYETKEIHMFLFAAPLSAVLAPGSDYEIAEAVWVPFQKVASRIGNKTDQFWFTSIADRVREALQRD